MLGSDVAGQVEAVGRGRDPVPPRRRGLRLRAGTGGFAEYVRVPEDVLGPKPANLSFEQAAAVPLAALTALQGLRDHGRVQPGDKVLIIGASGGVGTFAVQLAKRFGAEVTGVCSTRNLELVRSLGADHVIDYTREDFTRGGRRYDVDLPAGRDRLAVGLPACPHPQGTLILSSGESDGRWIGPMDRILKAVVLSPFVGQRLAPFVAKQSGRI